MNDLLQKQVGELIGVIQGGLNKGIETAQTQFPILCGQILKYNLVGAIVTACLCLLGSTLVSFGIYKCIKFNTKKEDDFYNEDGLIGLSIFLGVIFIVLLIGAICSLFDIMKISLAPNVYLLEYFKNFVTPVSK